MPRIFSTTEMERRVARLRRAMGREGIDCAIASSIHNSFYYSGFWFGLPYGRFGATVIPEDGQPTLISARMESHRARDFTWLDDVRTYSDEVSALQGWSSLIREVVGERGLAEGKIGMEADTLPYSHWHALKEALPQATLVDVSGSMMNQRLVKSEEEIELTRQGAQICLAAIKAGEEALGEGVTEIEVAAAEEAAMQQEYQRRFPEYDYTGGQAWCQSGHRTIYGHGPPTGKRIERGDLVKLAVSPITMGYFHVTLRERVVGPVPQELAKPFAVRLEAAQRCLDTIKPGVKCSDIDRLAIGIFEKAGLAQYKGLGTGHSFGIMGPFWGREELGELRIYNDTPLQEGMIVSVEPSLYIPHLRATLITVDMVLVTSEGCEVLTDYPSELSSV